MQIEFDQAKSDKNARERGLPFELAEFFEFATALEAEDTRRDYGEKRMLAYGYIDERLHVLCFKPIGINHIRVISLRKANKREEKKYAKEI